MCGIAGIVRFQSRTSEQEVRKMTDSLVHRGPDGEGIWLNETQNVGLGHRRLAIIDLSSKGQQPMLSDDGRYVITFNGEIYNYVELREELKKSGQVFKTENDTEVLIKLFQSKGAECLSDLDGMFAFAVWDNHTNTLFCARDRFGEKPFYYFKDANQFVFASEMKAIWSIGIPRILNTRMAYNYEFFGYQSNPTDLSETFFQNIQALPAGHFLIMKDNKISVKKYYSIELKQEYGHTNADQVAEELKDLMRKSVSRRLRGQVVVGSSFSGGLDSSVIVSEILQILQGRNQNLDVFSAVFPGFEKNEEKFIKKMIEGKKITPHFIMPDQEAYQKIVEKLYYHQEAPFTSSSVIAQYFIYQKAREKNVLVLLDGQGADEVFGGYHGSY
ncbi:MAG: asparagine synthase (glutamine-hydrolyzing), partial [Crocinitomicaceae bacterium]|nr:asparagine synthase (glutamine-hydrolyzing) [Crocinitomicaceae bacterium]